MSKNAKLIELRKMIYAQMLSFIDDLDESARSEESEPDAWSIKDNLVHVALWDERRGKNLVALSKGESPQEYPEYEELNAQEYEIHKNDSWEQVHVLISRSHEEIMTGLHGLGEDQLSQTGLLTGAEDRQLWGSIAGTNVLHPLIHMAEYLSKNDQAERALEMVQQFSGSLSDLDDDPEWQGLIVYNQACYYALVGEKGKAIDLLEKSLDLRPDLNEWSQQDSDLDSLRDEDGYKFLFAGD